MLSLYKWAGREISWEIFSKWLFGNSIELDWITNGGRHTIYIGGIVHTTWTNILYIYIGKFHVVLILSKVSLLCIIPIVVLPFASWPRISGGQLYPEETTEGNHWQRQNENYPFIVEFTHPVGKEFLTKKLRFCSLNHYWGISWDFKSLNVWQ